jgi:hypothetical protein
MIKKNVSISNNSNIVIVKYITLRIPLSEE